MNPELQNTDNQRFIDAIKVLKNINGYKIKTISGRTGINYHKIRNIIQGRSTAKTNDLNVLINAFPELTKKESEEGLIKEIELLHSENQQLKQQLFEAIKEKDLKQETIEELLDLLKKYK